MIFTLSNTDMTEYFVPIITVMVPLYNKAKEIGRCISILTQTYSDFELIIVDGGSTDGSLEIAKEYCDKRICIINQKSKGAAAGRNEGIHASSNELIAFLDADDEWMPTFLETIVHLRVKYPDAGMYGMAGYAALEKSHQIANYRETPIDIWDGYVPYITNVNFDGPGISMSGVAIPKNVFETVGEFNENLCCFEDVEMFGRISYEYPIAYSTAIGYIYYLASANKITDTRPEGLDSHPLIDYYESILGREFVNKKRQMK